MLYNLYYLGGRNVLNAKNVLINIAARNLEGLMANERKYRAGLVVLLCWILFANPVQAETPTPIEELAASAVQAAPASAVQAVPTAADNYEAAVKADEKGDIISALKLFQLAADAGHTSAQVLYAGKLKSGQLFSEALKYLRLSAQGNRDGQYALGTMYEVGDGVKQDVGVARFLFGMAAEQGHREASMRMADAYLNGQAGLDEAERQGPEALSWIRRAAGHNHLPSLDALAVAYREGKLGLTADPDQADVIVAITNKLRGIVIKPKKKSALYRLLKGDPDKE